MVKTKIIGDINISDELKTAESITKYLNDTLGKLFNKEKFTQVLAEVLLALNITNAVNNNDNTNTPILPEEKQMHSPFFDLSHQV